MSKDSKDEYIEWLERKLCEHIVESGEDIRYIASAAQEIVNMSKRLLK